MDTADYLAVLFDQERSGTPMWFIPLIKALYCKVIETQVCNAHLSYVTSRHWQGEVATLANVFANILNIMLHTVLTWSSWLSHICQKAWPLFCRIEPYLSKKTCFCRIEPYLSKNMFLQDWAIFVKKICVCRIEPHWSPDCTTAWLAIFGLIKINE